MGSVDRMRGNLFPFIYYYERYSFSEHFELLDLDEYSPCNAFVSVIDDEILAWEFDETY